MAMRPANLPRVLVSEVGKTARVPRAPRHSFQLRQRPWEITPFLIAPVLPGETMKNLLLQSRVISDPILNRLCGWWCEYFIFYVKLSDVPARAVATSLMIDPATDVSSIRLNGGDTWKYVFDDAIDWQAQCLEQVVTNFFRDDGEVWDTPVVTAGRPAARIVGDSWLDSAVDTSDVVDPLDIAIETTSADTSAAAVDAALRQYHLLLDMGLTEMTYEDYLRSFGVKAPDPELSHRPELIRYSRSWAYPVAAIDPTDGSAASAVTWSVAERADKDRYFKEPGFIFGVSVVRPKVYFRGQLGAGVGMLDSTYRWLPAVLQGDPRVSLANIAAGDGPVQGASSAYTVDIRDLFIYGDQFVNFDPAATDANMVDLPNATMTNKKYPDSDDADALFAGASPANQIRQDGIVSLTIMGRQVDRT